jgi:3-hydroxyacyl-[acyl-carrier-protein] dehydratase
MRYTFCDRVLEMRPGEFARGVKNIALTEDFFASHFPTFPVVPGVLIVEAMAQVAGALVRASASEAGETTLERVRSVKFRHYVRPGDQLILDVQLLSFDGKRARLSTEATVNGRLVASVREMTLSFRPE